MSDFYRTLKFYLADTTAGEAFGLILAALALGFILGHGL